MPQFETHTKSATQIWKSADGQRTIWEVILEVNGKAAKAKTYSQAIANTSFSGMVESYEKEGKNGPETFVKQVPKAGGFQRQPKDEEAIKAMWAIGQAIAWLNGKHDQDGAEHFGDVESLAKGIFTMVDRVKLGETAKDTVYEVEDGPLDLSKVREVFGE